MGTVSLELEPILQERGMSLDGLAMRAGIEDVKTDKIKKNQVSAIRFSTLSNICEVLGCVPGDVLKYVD